MILKGMPKKEWPVLQLKVTAQEALRKQRPDWGYKRKWEGNYLASVSTVFTSCYGNIKNVQYQKIFESLKMILSRH